MEKKIYIFGAHSRARTLAAYLDYLYEDIHVEAFLYDNDEKNPDKIGEIPVLRQNMSAVLFTDYPVYIGTRGIWHPQITEKLKQAGFKTIRPVTQELDLRLRNQYLEKYYASVGREYLKLDRLAGRGKEDGGKENLIKEDSGKEKTRKEDIRKEETGKEKPGKEKNKKEDSGKEDSRIPDKKTTASIYVVKSPFDKPLLQSYEPAPYEKEIYAGAVLAEKPLPLGVLKDDAGENISDKNKQFCELTALYWLWKHAEEDIIGLVHYRRHFLLPKDWKKRMIINRVDAVLPVPLYVAPDVEENFKSRHAPSDWEFMMEYLEKNDAGSYLCAKNFFRGNLYSPCNMFIMRREILEEMCVWLFPLLFKAVRHGGTKEDGYQNRYPGFLSERLLSLFFEKNRERFRVVYSDKNFLS